jgi:hypothetical protein
LTENPNDEMTNADSNGNATLDGDAPKRPMSRKKAKQLLRRGGGDACIEAFEQTWTKKKEADADKKAKNDDRFNKALKIKKREASFGATQGYKGARRLKFEENARRRNNHDIEPKCHVCSEAIVL